MMTRRLVEPRLIIATHNRGKVQEIAELLASYSCDIVAAGDLDLAEPEETGPSFAANAILKAQAAAQAAGFPALADDSGLAVDALGGRPGIYSARWGGEKCDFSLAMRRVFDEMPAGADPAARFVCALCLAWPDPDPQTAVFIGEVTGKVVWPPRGDQGFGYDPIFVPTGHEKTFGEMAAHEKEALSHRFRAFRQLAAACLPEPLPDVDLDARPDADSGR